MFHKNTLYHSKSGIMKYLIMDKINIDFRIRFTRTDTFIFRVNFSHLSKKKGLISIMVVSNNVSVFFL